MASINLDHTIVTAFISILLTLIIQGLVKRLFSKGSIVSEYDCGEVRKKCDADRKKELDEILKRLEKGEKIFGRLMLAAKVQAVALYKLCEEKNLADSMRELDDFIKGRGDFKE